MDVVSICPLPVASFVFRRASGEQVQTIVCKATFDLLAGECRLAAQQEPLHDDDKHYSGDPAKSVYAAGDLAPFKARADVLLVGKAFAPRKEPVRSLRARLVVADVDKSIEVHGDRSRGADGQVREAAPFTSMPLPYERAAGGPATWNPAGVSDAQGGTRLPNLQPPGASPGDRSRPIAPIGFGPIAAGWPQRRMYVDRAAGAWPDPAWRERPLPERLDPAYFNAAPQDQQASAIRPTEPIVLEHLHRDHPRLTTRLPGLRPAAWTEAAGETPRGVQLTCDTLWIDTDRSICTVTWRGQLPLPREGARGRVVVSMVDLTPPDEMEPTRPLNGPGAPDASPPWLAPRPDAPPPPPSPGAAIAPANAPPASPPIAAPANSPAAPPLMAPIAAPAPAPAPPAPPPLVAPIASPASRPAAPAPPPLMAPIAPPAPPPLAAKRSVPPLPPLAAKPSAPPPPPMESRWAPEPRQGSAPVLTVGEAAALAARAAPAPAAPEAPASARAPARAHPGEVVELLWFDPPFAARIRKRPESKPILAELKPAQREEQADPETPADKRQARDRRDLAAILGLGEPIGASALEEAIAGAMDEGTFSPPLVLLAGDLELPFDPLEALRATIAAAAPFAPGDKALKDTIESASELLRSSWLDRAGNAAEGPTARIKEAFAQAFRALPAGHLEAQADRILLEQRHYQKRAVLGQRWLRALLTLAGGPPPEGPANAEPRPARAERGALPAAGEPPIPTYLPEALASELPMFQRFRVRLFAEARPQLDQYEPHPIALRAVALGRALPKPKRG
jgi:hypothetical protein